jgi:protein TonB
MGVMKAVSAVLLLSIGCASAPPPQPAPPSPAVARKPAPEEDDGVEGGVEGGVAGGVTGDANAPRLLPPNVGVAQRLADVRDPRYRPVLRPEYNHAGAIYWALFKVCVSTAGEVTSVSTLKSTRVPAIDADWRLTIKSWPHRPYERDGKLYPFCYPMRLEIRSTPKPPA